MGFFDRMFGPTGTIPVIEAATRETPGVPSTTSPSSPTNQIPEPKSGDWKANIIRPIGRGSLLIPAWSRGVSLIMQTMGQMVIQYQQKNVAGGNFFEDNTYAEARALNYLLQIRPNPVTTASQLQEQIEFKKIYYGNAYIYIERNDVDWPVALWLASNGNYDYMTDTYYLTYNRPGGPRMVIAESRDVLHFKNIFVEEDGYLGIPTIRYAMQTLSIAATGGEQSLKDMAKGGKNKILIQEKPAPTVGTRGRLNQEEMRKATKDFNDDWLDHDAVFLDNMADAKIINQTAQELRLLETRGYEDEDVARILGVPKVMLMIGDGGSYKMPEHATQEFMLRTIQPRIREGEDEYNSKLLDETDFGKRRIHICERALRRLDAKGQAEIDKLRLETGWSINEVRAQYDLPSIKDGDKHYMTAQVAEVGSAKLSGEIKTTETKREGGNA